jgi:hypothetical protein
MRKLPVHLTYLGCALVAVCLSACTAQRSADTSLTPAATDAAEPAIAAGPDGTAFVVWMEHLESGGGNVMFNQLNRDGHSVAAPSRVNSKSGEATAWRGDPPTVVVAPDGTIYVGWTARSSSEARATDIFLSRSHDRGRTFEPPVKVNDDSRPGDHGMHSLAVAEDGAIYVAWLDERNSTPPPVSEGHKHEEGNREVYLAQSRDGGRSFSPNQRLAGEACPCCKTSLKVGADGRVYASWRQVLGGNLRHIAVASSGDGGRSFSAPVIVSDDQWILAGCPVSGASLSVTAEGTLRVLWYSAGAAGPAGLYWTESRDNGQSFSPRQLLAQGNVQGTPVLLSHGKRTMAIWQEGDHDASRMMTAQLAAAASESRDAYAAGESWNTSIAGEFRTIGSGEVPAALTIGEKLLVVYVTPSDQLRTIRVAVEPADTNW